MIDPNEVARLVGDLDLGSPTARKSGRNPRWPYVPIIIHPVTPTSPKATSTQIKGLAYASRDEAIAAANRHLDQIRSNLIAKLIQPRYRALREQYGLPREIGEGIRNHRAGEEVVPA